MTKRKLAWGAIIVALLISAIGFSWTFFGIHEVTMTQAELQAKIDARMPHTTKSGVTVDNVRLDLSNDKIGISMDARATKLGTSYSMSGATTGTLTYNGHEGSFYFVPDTLQITNLQADGGSVGDKVGSFIDKWVDSKKINDNKSEIMAKAEEMAQSLAQKSAETVLSRVPVYTLPDDFKGNVVRVFLKDVEVKNGTVIAHLSLWQFTKMVIFYSFVLVISVVLAIGLMLNPEWGLALLFLGSLGSN
ncbi:MAG: hypothetical protein KC777_26035 [Cyanobacteria bacterium HKST-UBA02]|nr:hypothetical protein [Cyanobacteria bacterium HKST-UBA02]